MSLRPTARIAVLAGVAIVAFALAAAPAAATITPHAGNCTANGQFSPGGFRDAASASITIPREASVAWAGAVIKAPPEEERTTTGEVRLKLPLGQQVTLGEWNTTGVEVANNGTYTYELPSVLSGFEMTFSGEHYEPEGLWCSGEVTIKVEGSNPIGIATLALSVISVVGVSLSITQKKGATGITEYRKGDVL
ncbi:MAG: hypothetical protein JRI23_21485 [Deltaproteobacteria bacterium]|jgi:hypothetical protein|nr:hypothetical protein [Deltaproteobacteria bacterium]MBW2534515.1 hypothetical protein [Deltaproteobacteria bacterium]